MSKYYSQEKMKPLRGAFEREVLRWPGVSQKQMFGCPCYWSNGKMFAFLVTGGVVPTQLSDQERAGLARRFATTPFGTEKRSVARWPVVPVKDAEELKHVLPFVRKSLESVR